MIYLLFCRFILNQKKCKRSFILLNNITYIDKNKQGTTKFYLKI